MSSHNIEKVRLGSYPVVIGVTKDSNSTPNPPRVIKIISDSFNLSPIATKASF